MSYLKYLQLKEESYNCILFYELNDLRLIFFLINHDNY